MSVQANPFKRTTIIIMFAVGFAAFVALLYGLGVGDRFASGKNGQAHGASNSLVGYKALADLMRKTGIDVQYSRTAGGIDNRGLLILTPGPYADAEDVAQVMQDRAYVGPTMIILPKWQVMDAADPRIKKGWVQRLETLGGDSGQSMLKNIADVEIAGDKTTQAQPKSRPLTRSAVGGPVKIPESPVSITGDYIRTVVPNQKGDGALVAYLDDGGVYAQLDSLDESRITDEEDVDASRYPLVLVADADLMNNTGMADKQTAKHALALIAATGIGAGEVVTFDLTFNGLGSSENLLTLAFQPPFLSATICLIIAAMAAAWMAFNRFGPPARERRSIDFGKTALVNNSAGFIHRMQREHLVAAPYGEMIRAEAIHAIGLSPGADRMTVNAKLDALGEVDGSRFSVLLANLNQAQNSRETAQYAAALYHWKKEIIG
ncbi:MAG: DUF4350 domain-containing protein [Parasphingorhabdus sp.]|uniref:DUF4350 domain-containing protein n=1 Tax=Parasphingorhabdus sp. TaxID=2709688 RepID=UPI00300393EB